MTLETLAAAQTIDLSTYRTLFEPIVQFFTGLILSGVSVAYVVQFAKSELIPVEFEKYPRTTAAAASVIATLIALYTTDLNYVFNSVFAVIAFCVGVFLVAAWTYRTVIKGDSKKEVPPAL